MHRRDTLEVDLTFNPQYSILICTRCEYAIVPTAIRVHLKTHHDKELSDADITAYAEACSAYDIAPLAITQQRVVPPETLPIPHLKTHLNGIRCKLCVSDNPYICCSRGGIVDHLKNVHE